MPYDIHPTGKDKNTLSFIGDEHLHTFGLLPAVSKDLSQLFTDAKPENNKALLVRDLPVANTTLCQKVTEFVKEKLPEPTFNHSMRVYYFGEAVRAAHLPHLRFNPEVFLLLALLHDLGTASYLQLRTVLSFEFSGGLHARALLLEHGAPEPLADSIMEAIIRHQDIGEVGMLSALTALIQVATLFDNTGSFSEWVHERTLEDVVKRWPRLGWTGCFKSVAEREQKAKPWSHTNDIPDFVEMVEGNTAFDKFENP